MAANSFEEREQSTSIDTSKQDSLPVVLQCNGCSNVVGDSCSWISSDRELEIISLDAVTSVVAVGQGLETSTQGADIGSTFTPLHCAMCKSPLGRIYRTTPKQLDQIRNMYCLDVEHIKSYQVGSTNAKQKAPITPEEILSIPTAKALQHRINQIESVIMMLIERIAALEAGSVSTRKAGDQEMALHDWTNKSVLCEVPTDDEKKTKKKRK